jgi:hypothetical protein
MREEEIKAMIEGLRAQGWEVVQCNPEECRPDPEDSLWYYGGEYIGQHRSRGDEQIYEAMQYIPHWNCRVLAVFLGGPLGDPLSCSVGHPDGYECSDPPDLTDEDVPWVVRTRVGEIEVRPRDWVIENGPRDFMVLDPVLFSEMYTSVQYCDIKALLNEGRIKWGPEDGFAAS